MQSSQTSSAGRPRLKGDLRRLRIAFAHSALNPFANRLTVWTTSRHPLTCCICRAAKDARLTVAGVDATGKLSQVAVVPTHQGARNGVVTKHGAVYLAHSQLGKLAGRIVCRRAGSKPRCAWHHDVSKQPATRVAAQQATHTIARTASRRIDRLLYGWSDVHMVRDPVHRAGFPDQLGIVPLAVHVIAHEPSHHAAGHNVAGKVALRGQSRSIDSRPVAVDQGNRLATILDGK